MRGLFLSHVNVWDIQVKCGYIFFKEDDDKFFKCLI